MTSSAPNVHLRRRLRRHLRRILSVLVLLSVGPGSGLTARLGAQELQIAELGDCALESGGMIRGCVMGYRTVGALNEDRSNAVLFPSWGNGTSGQLLGSYVGAGNWVDPEEYFVIMVDLFGNGVSSSPSNSSQPPGELFPLVTIRDMVRAQHRLVTEVLGLDGLHAVVGISLGAFAVFEWTTTFPGFVANAVPVVGTPRVSSYDVLRSALARRILEGCAPERCDEARETYYYQYLLLLRSPDHWARTLSRDDLAELLASIPERARNLPATSDLLSQGQALDHMDITEPFGGSMERAAEVVQARMLIVVASLDALVTPDASREFARLTGARLVELDNDCGHQAFVCAEDSLRETVRGFLR
jgi:homoserine O-acetyltransferase/O-succinyltransferase